ncbi:MAG: DUF6605 domain-containing protein [Dehalococcoidia bacterium]
MRTPRSTWTSTAASARFKARLTRRGTPVAVGAIAIAFILGAGVLLVASPAPGTEAAGIALVRAGSFGSAYASSVTLSLPAASTNGTMLLATVANNGGASFSAPAGWIRAATQSDGNTRADVWYYSANPGGIASVTFTAAGAVVTAGVLSEWSGVATSTPLVGSGVATANGTSVTTVTTGAVTGDLAIATFGIMRDGGGALTTTAGSGWTALPRDTTTDWFHFDAAYRLGAPAGVVTQTETAGAPVAWSAALATFKASGAGTTPDFQVAASPASRSVASTGGSAGYTVTLTSVGGYANSVALALSSSPALPVGVSSSFAPSSVTPTVGGATATLTITVPAGATAGTYQLTVTGTGAGASPHSTSVTLTITASASNPIVIENQQPGSTAWQLFQGSFRQADDRAKQVKGYASLTSVLAGQSLTFYVTVNPAQNVSLDFYRMGWYGGAGGRLMQHVGPLTGRVQPACPIDATTGLTACPWTPTYTLNVPGTWTSGAYLALLTNAAGYQSYVPFVVRDDRPAALLYQQSVTTYQAYNNYPNDGTGKSFYAGGQTANAATKVSFDRPYNDNGAGHFLDFEFQFLQFVERSGYDVTYSTDVDTHSNGAGLLQHRGFLSVGHDEYWSKQMFDAAQAARDAGVSLGFFGANAAYWQVRFESSSSGAANRTLVCYKTAAWDPVQGPTTTTNFRNAPVNRPEQQLIGIQFSMAGNYANTPAPYVVTNAANWVFAGTGVTNGTSIPGIVGYEIDRYFPGTALPPNKSWTLLSASPFVGSTGTDTGNSSIYQAPSNAWVFAAGTIRWGRGLDASSGDARIRTMTSNILNTFVSGTPTPDFQLTVTPSSRSVASATGGSATYASTLTAFGGFSSAVAMSVSSSPALPAGVTTSFAPSSITPTTGGATSTLTVTVPAGATAGTYQLTIGASGGAVTHSMPVTLVISSPGSGVIAAVQAGTFREAYASSVALTLSSPSTSGTLLVATVANNGGATFTAPAGWVNAVSRSDGGTRADVWYYPNSPGGITSVTFSATGSGATAGVLSEWSGVATTAPLDGSGGATAGASTSVTTSTAGAVSGDLAVAAFGITKNNGGAVTTTPGAGWTALPRDATTDWFHFDAAYRIGAPAGTLTETETANAAVQWSGALATFKKAP